MAELGEVKKARNSDNEDDMVRSDVKGLKIKKKNENRESSKVIDIERRRARRRRRGGHPGRTCPYCPVGSIPLL